jgi:3-oxoacyl-[acyl-carrier-protein] synthase II
MKTNVVVTGLGPVSAIGCGRDPFWQALCAGTPGFGPITLCDATDSPSKVAAEVKDFSLEHYVDGGKVLARHTPRPTQLALAAAVLALHDAEIDLDRCDPDRLGLFVGTSVGNTDELLTAYRSHLDGAKLPPHAAFHLFNHSAACSISSFLNIRGPIHTTSSGCNSGIDALGQAMRILQSGAADAMLVIGTDCEVVREVMAALNASGSLASRYNDVPARASRPFDPDRDGNVIGEGAAALLIETAEHAQARRARVYARVAGYQICAAGQNRQYSHDAPELDITPCVRAFRGAMAEAGWEPADVDVINANGSSSVIYDRFEANAIAEVFGSHLPDLRIHSIKSMLGQHGAGSSALQAVTACLSIRRCSVPPTINHDRLDPALPPLRVVTELETIAPEKVLVHAIGLGGFYYSVAAFQAPPEAPGGGVLPRTGAGKVVWSAKGHPRFRPAERFQRPLVPWSPRSERH